MRAQKHAWTKLDEPTRQRLRQFVAQYSAIDKAAKALKTSQTTLDTLMSEGGAVKPGTAARILEMLNEVAA